MLETRLGPRALNLLRRLKRLVDRAAELPGRVAEHANLAVRTVHRELRLRRAWGRRVRQMRALCVALGGGLKVRGAALTARGAPRPAKPRATRGPSLLWLARTGPYRPCTCTDGHTRTDEPDVNTFKHLMRRKPPPHHLLSKRAHEMKNTSLSIGANAHLNATSSGISCVSQRQYSSIPFPSAEMTDPWIGLNRIRRTWRQRVGRAARREWGNVRVRWVTSEGFGSSPIAARSPALRAGRRRQSRGCC